MVCLWAMSSHIVQSVHNCCCKLIRSPLLFFAEPCLPFLYMGKFGPHAAWIFVLKEIGVYFFSFNVYCTKLTRSTYCVFGRQLQLVFHGFGIVGDIISIFLLYVMELSIYVFYMTTSSPHRILFCFSKKRKC